MRYKVYTRNESVRNNTPITIPTGYNSISNIENGELINRDDVMWDYHPWCLIGNNTRQYPDKVEYVDASIPCYRTESGIYFNPMVSRVAKGIARNRTYYTKVSDGVYRLFVPETHPLFNTDFIIKELYEMFVDAGMVDLYSRLIAHTAFDEIYSEMDKAKSK